MLSDVSVASPARKIPTNVLAFREGHPLDVIFAPRSIAVIGATERPGSVGRAIFQNLSNGPLKEVVFAVNAQHSEVLGRRAYPNLATLPVPIDLAVIVTPAPTVPAIIDECVAAGIKGAIVISAGFKEAGAEGANLEREVLERAKKGNLRFLGPNCLGLMRPKLGLNATFASSMAYPGSVGFISQSGALCTAVLDWSQRENVGFSAFVSIGSMADVGWGDLIDYLGNDPLTQSIVIYMESVGDARAFLSAAREVALTKPIIVLKVGHTAAAAKAAASHTGALTGSDDVLDAAFKRCGVLRVGTIAELFYMAQVLSMQPRPLGPRLTILTNAGGPGALATDALVSGGGKLATLSEATMAQFNEILPSHWSHNNPVDILGDATPERYVKAVEVAAKDPNSDGLLVVLTPQSMTEPTAIAESVKDYAHSTGKPVLASWMGGTDVAEGDQILIRAGIPTFPYPDSAARVFNQMWHYAYHLDSLYETPILEADSTEKITACQEAQKVIDAVRATGRTILTEIESKQILGFYDIPTVETRLASSITEAVAVADKVGYPVVLKLYSQTITHKTDIGGVKLNLANAKEVRKAYREIEQAVKEKAGAKAFMGVSVQPMVNLEGYELILGSSLDPQFGPVLLFGSGGQLVEVYEDRALGLPPLNNVLARRMMEQTKVYKALKGVRGRPPVDLNALEQLLVRFSHLVVEQPWIKEIDINPLLVSAKRLLALDARVILHPTETSEFKLPRLAIRPYPAQYVTSFRLKDGSSVTLRPIRPEDEKAMVRFHQTLSERSVYFRYLHVMGLDQRTAHQRLTRICFIDYDREMALVAERLDPLTGQTEILGVGRLIKAHGTPEAELAVLVSDHCQRQGLGQEFVRRLIEIARAEGLEQISGSIHPENHAMQAVCRKMGFDLKYSVEDHLVNVLLDFKAEAAIR